jgi:hypothetical protein
MEFVKHLMGEWDMTGAYIECGGEAETSSGVLQKHWFEQRT